MTDDKQERLCVGGICDRRIIEKRIAEHQAGRDERKEQHD